MKTFAQVVDEVFINSLVVAQRLIDAGIGFAAAFHGPGSDWDKCLEDGPDQLAAVEAEIEVFEAPVVAGSTGSGPGVEEPPLPPPGPHLREESVWWRLGSGGPW